MGRRTEPGSKFFAIDQEHLSVTVFNPNYTSKTLRESTKDRLEHINLYYCSVGNVNWIFQ